MRLRLTDFTDTGESSVSGVWLYVPGRILHRQSHCFLWAGEDPLLSLVVCLGLGLHSYKLVCSASSCEDSTDGGLFSSGSKVPWLRFLLSQWSGYKALSCFVSGSDSPWHWCEHPPGQDELLWPSSHMHASMWEAVRRCICGKSQLAFPRGGSQGFLNFKCKH